MADKAIQEFIKLCRDKAKLWTRAADALEQAAKSEGELPTNGVEKGPLLPKLGVATPQLVRDAVAEKQKRAATVAAELGVDRRDVEKIVDDKSSGLEWGERGWIRLAKQH